MGNHLFRSSLNVMEDRKLGSRAAPCKWFALQDAKFQNEVNRSNWSQKFQVQAERMKLVLPMFYHNSGIFVDYRKKMISIKVNDARVKAELKDELIAMEAEWVKKGVRKVTTAQGVRYRILA